MAPDPSPPPANPPQSSPSPRAKVTTVVLATIVVLLTIATVRSSVSFLRWPWSASPPKVTQEMVVTQIQDVAKLVSTELTLRDVVSFEQARFGLRRRMLLVVTGKVLAGIDLKKNVAVKIDDKAKTISIELPRAEVLGVEVESTRTYDETSTPFNRFQPEDRDRMQEQIRAQLRTTGEQSGLLSQADRSARIVLESLLARDGYKVNVTTKVGLDTPPRR